MPKQTTCLGLHVKRKRAATAEKPMIWSLSPVMCKPLCEGAQVVRVVVAGGLLHSVAKDALAAPTTHTSFRAANHVLQPVKCVFPDEERGHSPSSPPSTPPSFPLPLYLPWLPLLLSASL
jgi:hypothetical protein